MFRRLLICTILLLCLHGLARAELTMEQMESEGGIPALAAIYLRAFNAGDEAALRAFLGEYRDATSGFYVLPRLSGDRVTLMIAPQTSSVNPGSLPSFNIQNVQTTVSGRLGEWIEIGGLTQSSQRNSQSILSGRTNERQDSRTVLIRVEEIR